MDTIKIEKFIFPMPPWFPKPGESQIMVTARPQRDIQPERLMLHFVGGSFEFAFETPDYTDKWYSATDWQTLCLGQNIQLFAMSAGSEVHLHVRCSNLKHPSHLRRLAAFIIFWRRERILNLPHFQLIIMGTPLNATQSEQKYIMIHRKR